MIHNNYESDLVHRYHTTSTGHKEEKKKDLSWKDTAYGTDSLQEFQRIVNCFTAWKVENDFLDHFHTISSSYLFKT